MKNPEKNNSSNEELLHFGSFRKAKFLVGWFTFSGILVSAAWIILFVAGLLVDSSYYRAAISYNFAELSDWIWVIATFTFSNVVILAFFSGLLGGITSKLLYTNGFTITKEDFKKVQPIQIENPFISAFRGMFVFVAILSMQYVSSFTDFGSIGKSSEQAQVTTEIKYEKLYSKLSEKIKDTVLLRVLRSGLNNQMELIEKNETDSSIINQIFLLKNNLRNITHDTEMVDLQKKEKQKHELETKIKLLRRSVKVPSNSDFSVVGISSFSYFKFAVIVSFLAFIFGYDPSKFTEFLGKILKGSGKKRAENGNVNESEPETVKE